MTVLPRCASTWHHDRSFQCTGPVGHDGCHHFGNGAGWTDEEADESPLVSAMRKLRVGSAGNGARLNGRECTTLCDALSHGAEGAAPALAVDPSRSTPDSALTIAAPTLPEPRPDDEGRETAPWPKLDRAVNRYVAYRKYAAVPNLRGHDQLLSALDDLREAVVALTPDPAPTGLHEAGRTLLAAALDYRTLYGTTHVPSAVVWLEGDDGSLVIVTRGEYRDTLMANIPRATGPHGFTPHPAPLGAPEEGRET